jgi:hypothetical protein
MNGCREGEVGEMVSLAHLLLLKRVLYPYLLSSRYFVILKYYPVPVEFGGGGSKALHAEPPPPETIGNSKDDSLNDYASYLGSFTML